MSELATYMIIWWCLITAAACAAVLFRSLERDIRIGFQEHWFHHLWTYALVLIVAMTFLGLARLAGSQL